MEAQHTPGRLEVRGTVVYFDKGAGGFDIRRCPAAEANARRLAACWNACEDLPTELLEKHGVTRSGIAKGVEELTRQRDELLAALQGYVLAIAVGGGDDKASVMAAIRAADNNARALIAKIGGAA